MLTTAKSKTSLNLTSVALNKTSFKCRSGFLSRWHNFRALWTNLLLEISMKTTNDFEITETCRHRLTLYSYFQIPDCLILSWLPHPNNKFSGDPIPLATTRKSLFFFHFAKCLNLSMSINSQTSRTEPHKRMCLLDTTRSTSWHHVAPLHISATKSSARAPQKNKNFAWLTARSPYFQQL